MHQHCAIGRRSRWQAACQLRSINHRHWKEKKLCTKQQEDLGRATKRCRLCVSSLSESLNLICFGTYIIYQGIYCIPTFLENKVHYVTNLAFKKGPNLRSRILYIFITSYTYTCKMDWCFNSTALVLKTAQSCICFYIWTCKCSQLRQCWFLHYLCASHLTQTNKETGRL